jgi:3-oxoacyl-(acyl-carrier-protein) synthase
MFVGAVSIRYGFRGPNLSATTACASGAHAIGEALCLLRARKCNAVVAGVLHVLCMQAWSRMALQAPVPRWPKHACDGFNLLHHFVQVVLQLCVQCSHIASCDAGGM